MRNLKNMALGCILAGITLAGIGGYEAYSVAARVRGVAAWPSVPGYVSESAIMWRTSPSASESQERSSSYNYRLRARTEYVVDGRGFTNTTPGVVDIIDRKYFNRDPWTNPPTEEIAGLFKKLPQGTLVSVRYNPADPPDSCILVDLSTRMLYGRAIFLIFSGGLLILIPVGVALLLRKLRPDSL